MRATRFGQVAELLDARMAASTCSPDRTPAIRRCRIPTTYSRSGFYTQINTAVASLARSRRCAATASDAWLSPTFRRAGHLAVLRLSVATGSVRAALPTVQVGQNQTEIVGLSASHNGLIPADSTGQRRLTTTGSYMRDVLRALATIGSLSSTQATPGFRISCRTHAPV